MLSQLELQAESTQVLWQTFALNQWHCFEIPELCDMLQ